MPSKAFEYSIKKMCFSGEGRVHAKYNMAKSNSFTFESLLNLDEMFWLVGLDLPFNGQETLKIDYSKISNSKIKISGQFYRRLLSQIKEQGGNYYSKNLKKSFVNLGIFFYFYTEVRNKKNYKGCTFIQSNEYEVLGKCNNKPLGLQIFWKLVGDQFVLNFSDKNLDGAEFQIKFSPEENTVLPS